MTARARKRRDVERLVTANGASAERDGELLVLRNRAGEIVVVFDTEEGSARIVAPRGDITLDAPEGRIALRAREVVCSAGRYELRAERIVERAQQVFREVDGLVQIRAERVRTLARDLFQVFARRTDVVADEDATMDGKRVLLG